jgi:hypothetical protein
LARLLNNIEIDHQKDGGAMTVLQDWLSIRPVDQRAVIDMVCRPLRAVLSTPDVAQRPELKLLDPGTERC